MAVEGGERPVCSNCGSTDHYLTHCPDDDPRGSMRWLADWIASLRW